MENIVENGTYVILLPNATNREATINKIVRFCHDDLYVVQNSIIKSAKRRNSFLVVGDRVCYRDVKYLGSIICGKVKAINYEKDYIQIDNIVMPTKALKVDSMGGYYLDWDIIDETLIEIDDAATDVMGHVVKIKTKEEIQAESYAKGWMDCLKEFDEWTSKDDSVLDKALDKLGYRCFRDLMEDDDDALIDIFNARNQVIDEMVNNKPKLTIDEIKQKLGYDFDLI